MRICPNCGKEVKLLRNFFRYKGAWYHKECFLEVKAKEKEQKLNERTCLNCGYNVEEIERMLPETSNILVTKGYHCSKFGFNTIGKDANQCSSFITKKQYEEMCMSGTLNPEIEGMKIFKKCAYCGSTYDLSKSVNCPKCGASNGH